MTHIFTYGSLMYEPVWNTVVRPTDPYNKRNASLNGYIRRSVISQEYPVVIKGEQTDFVEGVLYFGIGSTDLERLDKFEGDYYVRVEEVIHTRSGQSFRADVYALKDEYRHIASNNAWDSVNFESVGIHKFLDNYKGFDHLSV